MKMLLCILRGLGMVILASGFFLFQAFAEPPFEGAYTVPQKEFLTCTQNADCQVIENDCAHCCGSGTAINSKFMTEFAAQIENTCAVYKGSVCDCKNLKWEPRCVDGACKMKKITADAK